MKKNTSFFFLFLVSFFAYTQNKHTLRILFVPLDERPPCLQFPIEMGRIGGVELVAPPRELLGKFTNVGNSEAINQWILSQNLQTFDAAIISTDMLAFGGLVGSRVFSVSEEMAKNRLRIIELIKQKSPKIKIYGSSVIMRLAPTADGKNEPYREKLARWAEISAEPTQIQVTKKLEDEIPAEALQNYKEARFRNLQINRLAIELTQKNIINYLILSQDDAKPKGVHISERQGLQDEILQKNLTEKIAIQPGADEVSMLLLTRAISDQFNFHPRIKVIFSSESMADKEMPFEDRPLRKTVSFHIKAVGATEVTQVANADLLFYVFTSRFEQGRAKSFVEEITKSNKGVIVADIDPKGDVQGGDTTFNELLKKSHFFDKIYGYACWNTAGNTIGTALPHGFTYAFSRNKLSKTQQKSLKIHQKWFVMNRLLDDYVYHSIIRPKANKLIKQNGWNAFRLTPLQTQSIESFCSQAFEAYFNTNSLPIVGYQLGNFKFKLPWERTFEAEIDFNLLKND